MPLRAERRAGKATSRAARKRRRASVSRSPLRGGEGAVLRSDLADQVQRRGDGLGAFLPLGRAGFVRVRGDVLGGRQHAQGRGDVAGDGVVVGGERLDGARRSDDGGAAQRQGFFRGVHGEGGGQGVGGVADQ